MPSPNKGRFAVNGKRLLLDTNAIVQLLAGNPEVGEWVRGADFLATSVICEFEFLSFPRLSEGDAALYAAFAGRVRTFPVPSGDPDFTRRVVAFRNAAGKKLKMPDAIVAATAAANGCAVLTADDHFRGVPGLDAVFFRPI